MQSEPSRKLNALSRRLVLAVGISLVVLTASLTADAAIVIDDFDTPNSQTLHADHLFTGISPSDGSDGTLGGSRDVTFSATYPAISSYSINNSLLSISPWAGIIDSIPPDAINLKLFYNNNANNNLGKTFDSGGGITLEKLTFNADALSNTGTKITITLMNIDNESLTMSKVFTSWTNGNDATFAFSDSLDTFDFSKTIASISVVFGGTAGLLAVMPGNGVFTLDNIVAYEGSEIAAVPEPASFAAWMTILFLASAFYRRRCQRGDVSFAET